MNLVAKGRTLATERQARQQAEKYRAEGYTTLKVWQKRDGRWAVTATR